MAPRGESKQNIVKYLAQYEYLRPDHLAELVGLLSSKDNPYQNVYAHLQDLRKDRLVDSIQDPVDRFGLSMFYLTRKGWERAVDYGFASEIPKVSDKRSNTLFHHWLLITQLHMSLWRMLGERLVWKQRNIKIVTEDGSLIIPDALFGIRGVHLEHWFYLEVEKTLRDKKEKNGKMARINKVRGYAYFGDHPELWKRVPFDNFRLCFVLPNEEKVDNFMDAMEDEGLNIGRFWLTDHAGMLDLEGASWNSWQKGEWVTCSLSDFKY